MSQLDSVELSIYGHYSASAGWLTSGWTDGRLTG